MNKNNLKDIAYIIFIISMLLSNFYNNYINQLRFDKMEANFLHVLKTNQEKFDRIQEMNLRMFKYILNKQTKKTSVVENTTQTDPLLSESTQNNITTFISDNSTIILAVSAVVLAIVVYYYWQAPINAWFLSFFNNKPKDDDDKGNGGGNSDIGGNTGNSDIGGNNDVADSSDVGGNNDVADSSDVGEYSSNAIIPYDELNLNINQKYSEQSLSLQRQINLDTNQNYSTEFSDLQKQIDFITPNLLSDNFVVISNSNGETLRIDLEVFLKLFPQVFLKDGIPFIRCTDNTEVPLSQLDSLELLFNGNWPDSAKPAIGFDTVGKGMKIDPIPEDILNSFSNFPPIVSYDATEVIRYINDPESLYNDFDFDANRDFYEMIREMSDNYDVMDVEKTLAYHEKKKAESILAESKLNEFKEESSIQETNQIPTEKSNETTETISTIISDLIEIICKEN